VKVNVWPLGLLSINAPHQQWQLYPNPNTGNFKLRCNQEINEKVTIQVFDLLGSLVYQQVSANVKTDITVDCAALPTAIYILKIVPDEGVPTVFRFNKN
ncbi:MAG: T9SS C-terminal target domain-containing protein, partial [Chitinophagia bacterium]|nr:T9SS C-terminal target domain-containing protein [Chitinophagia bacterium]